MSRPPSVPQLVVEVGFASDPLAASFAKGVLSGSANSYFSTPDTTALRITGDIEIVARLAMTDWTPAAAQTIVSKSIFASTAFSLYVTTAGALELATSANGSTLLTATSAVPPFTNGTAYWVKATLDVNDGAGNRVYNFYWAPDSPTEPAAWTLLSTSTVSGTTSIFASTFQVEVGSAGNGSFRLAGDMYKVIVREGIGGTVRADFDPADAGSGSSTSWRSTVVSGQVWTVQSAASLSVSPSWTDISSYVRSVTGVQVRRGKQTEVETTASSSLSLTLDNRDRRFDPTYASGPYYGNLKPRKAIRVRALWDSTYWPIYQGFVDGWPQDYFFRRDASVRLTAYDALAIAGQVEIQSAAYDYLRTTVGDLEFYLFNVEQDRWFDLQGNTPAVLAQGTMMTDSIGDADGDGVSFDGSTVLGFGGGGGGSSFSVSFWLSTTSKGTGTASSTWTVITDARSGAGGRIGIDSSGSLCYENGTALIRSIRSVAIGRPLFCTIVQDGTSPSVYVNGVDESDASTRVTGSVDGPGVVRIGGPRDGLPGGLLTGVVQSLAGVSQALTVGEIQTLFGYARRDLVESTATRLGRLLDFMGWPAGLRDLTTHPQVDVREVPAGAQIVLSMMQTVADSEYGRMFVTKDGKVALQDRFWHLTSSHGSTTQATFSDDGSDLFYAGTGFDYSDREVANRVTVSGSFGRSATQEDATSKDDYGLQTFSLNTILSTQGEVTSASRGILSRRKEPILRTDAITVKPARQPTSWPTVLGLELGDRIVIEVTPREVSPQIQRTLLVERLDWSISIDRWELAITGSPVPSESYWILGTSELGTETVLGW